MKPILFLLLMLSGIVCNGCNTASTEPEMVFSGRYRGVYEYKWIEQNAQNRIIDSGMSSNPIQILFEKNNYIVELCECKAKGEKGMFNINNNTVDFTPDPMLLQAIYLYNPLFWREHHYKFQNDTLFIERQKSDFIANQKSFAAYVKVALLKVQ